MNVNIKRLGVFQKSVRGKALRVPCKPNIIVLFIYS